MPDAISQLTSLKTTLQNLRGIFDLDAKEARVQTLESQISAPGFWDQPQPATTAVIQEIKDLKSIIEPLAACAQELKTLEELAPLVGASDESTAKELQAHLESLKKQLDGMELKTLYQGPHDRNNAILSIAAGAGGTESCDWVSMLLRMYQRWSQAKGFTVEMLDYLAGEEAGVKSVTLLIKGSGAYGNLKSERGVHRLVRISPFDSNKRRHTSFAAVDVVAEIEDDTGIHIEEKDLKIDVFRSSGAGGQSVNTTDSAVRITHIPTGMVVQCQNERSQLKNKHQAMKVLRARLFEIEQQKRDEQLAKEYSEKQKIEWGSQIRSYVLHPYQMVKDHRTGAETGKAQQVLEGEALDPFIEAFLRWKAAQNIKGAKVKK
ncbi:MAG: peptide chain release factor 2 [Candidatus Omnitrophica bacterium]|nr:peptide chain release factor 2 [Candidatus Omnitrophota bacterium]